jgi:hypothetical protein
MRVGSVNNGKYGCEIENVPVCYKKWRGWEKCKGTIRKGMAQIGKCSMSTIKKISAGIEKKIVTV